MGAQSPVRKVETILSPELTEWCHWKWREYGEDGSTSGFILERKVTGPPNGIDVQTKEMGIIKDASEVW